MDILPRNTAATEGKKIYKNCFIPSRLPSMSGVASCHHVLGVEHLLGELGNGEGPVCLITPGGEGSGGRGPC